MKRIITAALALCLASGAANAETPALPDGVSPGAMMPKNLSDLSGRMAEKVTGMTFGEKEEAEDTASVFGSVSLFAGGDDEDPDLLEIKRIARELDSQNAYLRQIAALQKELLEFGQADEVAAYQSRIPGAICLHAFDENVCRNFKASFKF